VSKIAYFPAMPPPEVGAFIIQFSYLIPKNSQSFIVQLQN
jgi:hypothetical protein